MIDRQDTRLDLLADRHDFLRMVDPPARAELADVHEALDAGRDLDERAERLQPGHGALHARALGEGRRCVAPRIVRERLEAEADAVALLAGLDLEDRDVHLLPEPQDGAQ